MARREPNQLDRRLDELEQLAENSYVGAGSQFLNQAGDLCLQAGQVGRALEYFGMAIDSLVKADRFAAAMALCRKVLRISPEVVRARCTLAWLAIGNGFEGDACVLVDHYVAAAERASRERLAVSQLRRMGELAAGEELRMVVGEQLIHLGDDRTADHIIGMALSARNGLRTSVPGEQERWSTARRAVLLGPRELAA